MVVNVQAMINMISNPVNSTVPIAAEVLKAAGVYDKRKLFGVTTLDVVSNQAESTGLQLTCNRHLHAQASGLVETVWQIPTMLETHAGHCCHACAVLSAIRRGHKLKSSALYSTDSPWQAFTLQLCASGGLLSLYTTSSVQDCFNAQYGSKPIAYFTSHRQKRFRFCMLQVRAKTFYAEKKGLNVADVDVPVIGGHAGITILPLFSQASPHAQLSDEETDQLTKRTQDGGTEVVAAKAGKVISSLQILVVQHLLTCQLQASCDPCTLSIAVDMHNFIGQFELPSMTSKADASHTKYRLTNTILSGCKSYAIGACQVTGGAVLKSCLYDQA